MVRLSVKARECPMCVLGWRAVLEGPGRSGGGRPMLAVYPDFQRSSQRVDDNQCG